MNSERVDLKLYGVITEILPDGEISICEPVYINYWSNQEKKFYRLLTEDIKNPHNGIITYPTALEEIDISQFGTHLFLPASRKKINDGKKYFVLFQQSKNATIGTYRDYYRFPTIFGIDPKLFTDRDYTPMNLTVGIKFPNKFVAVRNPYRFLSAKELEKFIK